MNRRRKQGFAVPVHLWFRQGREHDLLDMLHQDDSPLRTRYVEQRVREHRSGQRDHGLWLWSLYVYLLWRGHVPSIGTA